MFHPDVYKWRFYTSDKTSVSLNWESRRVLDDGPSFSVIEESESLEVDDQQITLDIQSGANEKVTRWIRKKLNI